MEFKVEIEGAKEMERALSNLSVGANKNIMRGALMAAAKPVEARARAIAVGYGFSRKRSLAIRRKFVSAKASNDFLSEVFVGFSRRDKRGGFVLGFWEVGFQHVGGKFMGPRSMIRKAIIEKKQEAVNIFAAEMRTRIVKAAERQAQKAK